MNSKSPEELKRDVQQLSDALRLAAGKFETGRTNLYSIEELVNFIKSLDDEQLKKMMQLITFCILGFKAKAIKVEEVKVESPDS